MGLATFKGGIHPKDGKELSKDCAIQTILPKGELVYPLVQHIGQPAAALVKEGERVLVGQKIAEASGWISSNIICSVSGTVKGVEPRLTVSGERITSIIVENDGKYEKLPDIGRERDASKLSKAEIREIIREAGIVGLGGAGFPTDVKLTPEDDGKIEYVIINAAECEPYLTSDYRVIMEDGERLIKGLQIEMSLFEHAKGIIGIEDNKPEAISRLKELTAGMDNISVMPLKTKYPQGGERFLIYGCTGRMINSSMLPADVGCIVSNTDTAVSICRAVCESTPLLRRIITVSGDAVTRPGNYSVLTGTSYEELAEAAGFRTEPKALISGGPMMGLSLETLAVPVTKTSSALLAFTEDEAGLYEESSCIRCGRCLTVCPGLIAPQKLMEACERQDLDAFERLKGMECCECGSCTYICPARRRMTQAFREARRSILDRRKKENQ